jgi:hypothetical protein
LFDYSEIDITAPVEFNLNGASTTLSGDLNTYRSILIKNNTIKLVLDKTIVDDASFCIELWPITLPTVQT